MGRKRTPVPGGAWPSAALTPNAKALSRSEDLRSHVFGKRALGRTFWPPNPRRASSPVLALNRLATVKGRHGARPVVGDPLRRASLRLPNVLSQTSALGGKRTLCQQLYTPAAHRRVVRRATPATLTGVKGRPTLASAGAIRLNESVAVSVLAASVPRMATTDASRTILSVLGMVISLLQFCNSRVGRSFP